MVVHAGGLLHGYFCCFDGVETAEGEDGGGTLVLRFLFVFVPVGLFIPSQEVVVASKRYPAVVARTSRSIFNFNI